MLRGSAEDVVGAALEVSAKTERMAATLEASIFVAMSLKVDMCLVGIAVEKYWFDLFLNGSSLRLWQVQLMLVAGRGQQERLKYTCWNMSSRTTLRSSGNGHDIDVALPQRDQVHQCYNWRISAKVCF